MAPSFGTSEITSIVLQFYGATNVTLSMKTAIEQTQVTVIAGGAVLQTETASRAWNIGHDDITTLPISNNNPVMLGSDLPGVYMRPLGIYTDPWTVTSQFLINGGLMYLNEFQIDGSPNDAELGANTYGYTPPAYAVKEFTVSANNYDAQYGHTSGGRDQSHHPLRNRQDSRHGLALTTTDRLEREPEPEQVRECHQ